MVNVSVILLSISLIIIFGFLAEYIFKKTKIPDVLLLILLGITIGPTWMNAVKPEQVQGFAPVFTAFALLFLLFDGAFNINLYCLFRQLAKTFKVTLINFLTSAVVVAIAFFAMGYDPKVSLLMGFVLGGISSAFVIPVLKSLGISGESYSIIMLESAITDVLCIVLSLTMFQLIKVNSFNFLNVMSTITSLFAVATFVGILTGIIWILVLKHALKEHKFYMLSLAYVILVYTLTEYLGGNGAIATLVLGLVLRNSADLTSIADGIVHKKKNKEANEGGCIVSPEESVFFSQISFFLKTFFFVYIGLLIPFKDIMLILAGAAISLALMASRLASNLATNGLPPQDRKLIAAVFARGLAAAAIMQFISEEGFMYAQSLSNITYIVIFFTIILSSLRIFIEQRKKPGIGPVEAPTGKRTASPLIGQ